MKQILLVLISFCTHFLLVKLGTSFTLPFGYVSIIWPASGVMLGLYFLFGRSVLLGIFLSSLFTMTQDSDFDLFPNYLVFVFATISIVQPFLSKLFVLRFCNFPIKINKPKETIKFLILTGPLASLLSNVIFVACLWFTVPIELEALAYIGVVKWIGDTMSIVFFTPIFLFLYNNKFVNKARATLPSMLTSIFCFLLVNFIFLLVTNDDYKDKKVNFVRTTQPFVEQFNITQTKIKHHLKSLDGLFLASDNVTRDDFKNFTNKISNADTKIRGLAWLPYVEGEDRKQFESTLKREMLTDISIKKLTDKGMVVAPEQSLYIPIYFVEPLELNKAAIGLDISTHPDVSQTLIKAINTKNYSLSPLTSLAQEPGKLTSMIVYYPIYANNSMDIEDFMGVVEVIFEMDVLLFDIYSQYGEDRFTYQFKYGEDIIFSPNTENRKSLFTYSVDIEMFDKKGKLSFFSTLDFERDLISWGYLSIMVAGCIIGVICVMFVFFIVSFKSSLTRKVNEGTAELLKKNDELQAANEAKNLFLANISHEYRTPLNAIMGFTEIAKRETNDEVAKDYLSKIDNASNILLNIVNDVLDLSKMQAGEFTLESIAFQPSEVTQSVIEMLSKNANEKSITLTCEFSPSFDLWVNGDELRFKQIIINLINNAIKFTSSGGVKVLGECIDDSEDTLCLILKVIDTGIGIKSEDQERLFTSFAQAESSTTRKYGGTGLGLSIVKQLCTLMDGDIQLNSEVDKGTEFTIKLKLGKSTPIIKKQSQTFPANNELDKQNIDFSNMSILLVEDNKVNQIIAQKQLSSLGAKSDLAGDGQEALDYLADNIPDIILMDIQMPNMDGFTASHIIKHDPRLKHIPIIILSASVGKEDRDKASALGIFDFINKPFNQADLLGILTKYMVND